MGERIVNFSREAKEDLFSLDKKTRNRFIKKIKWLAINFEKTSHLPLSYSLQGFFKLRVGSWRVIYDFDSEVITIHQIERRDRVYKMK